MSLVGVIDCATKHVSFMVYKLPDAKPIAVHKSPIGVIAPKTGWIEQDPREIISLIQVGVTKCCDQLAGKGFKTEDVACVGITNQRDSVVAWDGRTSKPLYNAIMWKDIRTSGMVDEFRAKKARISEVTGLTLSEMFPALKMKWLLNNVPSVKEAVAGNFLKLGTIDSWVAWSLTNGSLHITDVTNASRTLLMNIDTLLWDNEMLSLFAIKVSWLPIIRSSSEVYGNITHDRLPLRGIRLSAIIGNQQASLLGQYCLKPGMAKNSYRSGCFLLCNIGEQPIRSKHGLLTTVAYKLGPNAPAVYALEGSAMVAGHVLSWLNQNLRILPEPEKAAEMAAAVPNSGNVYFVPAFSGLHAPHWCHNARGFIVGLTQYTTKFHLVRAALDAICFQTRDIIETMRKDGGFAMTSFVADGDGSKNSLLMQIQANLTGCSLLRSELETASALGAAMCAAQAATIELYKFDAEAKSPIKYDTFAPKIKAEEREECYLKWRRAVLRSYDWVDPKPPKLDAVSSKEQVVATLKPSASTLKPSASAAAVPAESARENPCILS